MLTQSIQGLLPFMNESPIYELDDATIDSGLIIRGGRPSPDEGMLKLTRGRLDMTVLV